LVIHKVRPVGARKLQQIRVTAGTNGADLGGGDQLLAVGMAVVGLLATLEIGPQWLARIALSFGAYADRCSRVQDLPAAVAVRRDGQDRGHVRDPSASRHLRASAPSRR